MVDEPYDLVRVLNDVARRPDRDEEIRRRLEIEQSQPQHLVGHGFLARVERDEDLLDLVTALLEGARQIEDDRRAAAADEGDDRARDDDPHGVGRYPQTA